MDTSTYEILKECNSGCRMALNSIEQLAVYLKSQEKTMKKWRRNQ